MQDFTLPSNIKQIGSIGSGLRVYMEDYVCTFLQQYALDGGYEERVAYLVGRNMVIDGQSVLFISGAIYGLHAEKIDGYLRFTQKSATYADDMLEEHFPGAEIVGWMQSQPSYGTYLNQHYGAYHVRQFTKPYQVLLVIDPLERANTFYATNPHAVTPVDRVRELGGYFVYYEKNVGMHEYMLTNKDQEYTTPLNFTDTLQDVPPDSTEEVFYDEYEEQQPERSVHYSPRTQRQIQQSKSRPAGVLASLCAVLFVVSFVLGLQLIRTQDRMGRMENEIQQLVTAHRNLSAQVIVSQDTALVFAQPPAQQPPAQQPPAYVPPASTAPAYVEQEALIPSVPLTYTIQPGDSLIGISLRFFGDTGMVNEILALNGIDNPDLIVAGRTIALPQR